MSFLYGNLISRTPFKIKSRWAMVSNALMPERWVAQIFKTCDWQATLITKFMGQHGARLGANGLLPESTKPLVEPMLTYHVWGPLAFNRERVIFTLIHRPSIPTFCLKFTYAIRATFPRGQWVNKWLNIFFPIQWTLDILLSLFSKYSQ